jgi:tRNA dimethylallyltransferase
MRCPRRPGDRGADRRASGAKGWPALHANSRKWTRQPPARLQPATVSASSARSKSSAYRKADLRIQKGPKYGPPFELRAFSLAPADRSELHRRIAARFDAMLQAGLVDELASLRTRFQLNASCPACAAVGYRQAWEFLEGSATRRIAGGGHRRHAAARQAPAHLAAQPARLATCRPSCRICQSRLRSHRAHAAPVGFELLGNER